jgi:hypothetical protein
MFVCCECCVLLGRGLCDVLITRPEESYRLWCVVVCDLETSWKRRPWPTGGCCAERKKEREERNVNILSLCSVFYLYRWISYSHLRNPWFVCTILKFCVVSVV